ncbi:M56 family peptidase [Alteromonas sediminis]|uniref:Protein TonB n=1 Tax=Alteromonas sediminis TaxID=2259342 RepID=A0A3N5Y0R2_9ALTE|nr:M56 family metallopeptidase [Alteromonas sediminis]RPJ66710.1 M56 family peptidase [Alteromonas sediminis]
MTDWLIEQTLLFSCTAVFLLFLQQPLRKAIGATGFYYLWAIIPIQMTLSSFSMSVYLPEFVTMHQYVVTASKAVAVSHTTMETFIPSISLIWLGGMAFCVLSIAIGHVKFVRRLRGVELKHNYFMADPALRHYCDLRVSIQVSEAVDVPMVNGFLKHSIVIPKAFFKLDATQQSLILEHEFVHFRRGDLYWNLMALAIVCLFWFNPIAWLSYIRFRQAQEMACDAQVLINKTKTTRAVYARTLLNQTMQGHQELLTTLHYGGLHNMKERISNIQTGFTYNWRLLPVAVALLGGSLAFQAVGENTTSAKADVVVSPVKRIPPVYPEYASSRGIEGTVVLSFSVEKDGSVSDIKVMESAHQGLFDAAAMLALQSWQYTKPVHKVENQSVAIEFVLGDTVSSNLPSEMEVIHIKA